MILFTGTNGGGDYTYHTYMFNGTRVVFFMDYHDAEKLQLNIFDIDEPGHAAIKYDDIKNIPVEKWKNYAYWPQCIGEEGDDCEIIVAKVSLEDASTDEKLEQFCSKRFYDFEVKRDNGEIV